MKRHGDDMSNKNKRFSFSNDNRPPMSPSPSGSGSYYSYQSPQMWVDPRTASKNHTSMNMYQPQNMMMQWSSPSSALFNPMQPPPPLPLDRPPTTPPPPPPLGGQMNSRRSSSINNNMRRTPNNSLRPDRQGYMNLGPYKKNINHQGQQNQQNHHNNHNNHNNQKNGPNLNSSMPGPSTSKLNKSNDGKPEDNINPKPTLKVNKKARRKPMSERYTCKKEWNREDAHKALELENNYNHLIKKVPMLILRFPDPELNKALIHSYSPAIETVHFQQPSRARYCFVQLKADSNLEEVKKQISQIEFGTGKISVENKITRHEVSEVSVTPEQLDPYTLYVGNLPTKLNVTVFKEKFPTAKRIDIGYAQRTKFTRYAFLHYDSVEDSMEAFRATYNLTIDARSLVVRFRRNKGSVGLSEKGKKTKKEEGEGTDGDKKDIKKPSGAPLFDDEMVDSKADVKEKAEELRKQGYGLMNASEGNSMTPNVKQEPVSEDECPSEDGFNDNDQDFDEENFEHSDFEGSDNDNDYDFDNNEYSNTEGDYETRHWESNDASNLPKVKEEKVDDYADPAAVEPTQNENAAPEKENFDDFEDELFADLNPDDGLDDGLDIGLDD